MNNDKTNHILAYTTLNQPKSHLLPLSNQKPEHPSRNSQDLYHSHLEANQESCVDTLLKCSQKKLQICQHEQLRHPASPEIKGTNWLHVFHLCFMLDVNRTTAYFELFGRLSGNAVELDSERYLFKALPVVVPIEADSIESGCSIKFFILTWIAQVCIWIGNNQGIPGS